MSDSENIKVRLDKYLWAIRLFKTRSIATAACADGKVKMNEATLKAAKIVKIGETYRVRNEAKIRIIEVKQLLKKRVSAPLVKDYYNDLTPPEEKEKLSDAFYFPTGKRGNKQARPTKKDRRIMTKFTEND